MTLLTLLCDRCGKPISGRTGYAAVSRQAAYARATALRNWRATNPDAHIRDAPRPVPWRLLHADCDSQPVDFRIDAARIRCDRALLHFVADCAQKPWCRHTDLRSLVAAIIVANPGSVPVSRRYRQLARARRCGGP